jgi:hypothetical protein
VNLFHYPSYDTIDHAGVEELSQLLPFLHIKVTDGDV